MQTTDVSSVSVAAGQLPAVGDNAVEILKNDHTVIKELLNELTAANDQARRMTVLEQLKSLLTIHNATEETLVYPALATQANKKWESEKLYHETALADILVFQLDTMIKQNDDAKFEPAAQALQKAILEHIDDEESKAFPHLEDRTESMEQQLLTSNVRQFRNSFKMQTAV